MDHPVGMFITTDGKYGLIISILILYNIIHMSSVTYLIIYFMYKNSACYWSVYYNYSYLLIHRLW